MNKTLCASCMCCIAVSAPMGVARSGDAARRSACATKLPYNLYRIPSLGKPRGIAQECVRLK